MSEIHGLRVLVVVGALCRNRPTASAIFQGVIARLGA